MNDWQVSTLLNFFDGDAVQMSLFDYPMAIVWYGTKQMLFVASNVAILLIKMDSG